MEQQGLPLSLEDIEAALCGTATPEQRARYCAAMNDPDSELNAVLNHIRNKPSALSGLLDEMQSEDEQSNS